MDEIDIKSNISYINSLLPKQYEFSELTPEQQKLAKIVNPDCESIGWRENEKLITRDSNGFIIQKKDPKDSQIELLMTQISQMTTQLNELTLKVNANLK
jgi:hypothetical protein